MELSGELRRADYRDAFDKFLEPGEYSFSLDASGGGKVALKIKAYTYQYEGKRARKWKTLVEPKSRIASGSTLNGTFVVPEDQRDRHLDPEETTRVKIIFTRRAGSKRVNYEFECNPV